MSFDDITPAENKSDIEVLNAKIDIMLTLNVVEFLGFVAIIISLISS